MSMLNSEYFRDPLSTVGNRALLKSLDQRVKDNNDALMNRAAAGGATFENQLAAMNANNRTMSDAMSNLLLGEDARKSAIKQQQMGLSKENSAAVQGSYAQAAQDWQAWGTQMGKAAMDYGSTFLLDK